jgi:hypothetical protein
MSADEFNLSKSISHHGGCDAAFEDSISNDGTIKDCATFFDNGATLEDGNSDDGAALEDCNSDAFEDSITDNGTFEDCATFDVGAALEDGNSKDDLL